MSNPTPTQTTYTVIYRTGGTENFRWLKALPVATKVEAQELAISVRSYGRVAIVHRTDLLDAIGMPETFDVKGRG